MKFLRANVDSVNMSMINDARYGIMDVLNVTEGVDTVMVFRNDLIMVTTNRFTYEYDYDLMTGEEWKRDIYAGLGKSVISLNTNGIASKLDDRSMITIGRAIYDIDSQERTGVLLMNISGSLLDRMLISVGYDNVCFMGTDGSFLAGNEEYAKYYSDEFKHTTIGYKKIRINRREMMLSGAKLEGLPIVALRVSPFGLQGIPMRMLYVLLFLLVVFLGLGFYVVFYVRKNISDPVFALSDSMEKNRLSGSLEKLDVDVPNSELEMLEDDYNSMIDHVNDLIAKLIEKEKNLQNAEMRVLQEQIKPHFLYNSIDTIGYMALDAGAEKVHETLETLGSFYRNFLSKGERVIPLSREVLIVKDYLSIQKLRYGEILNDEYDIAEDTKELLVPRLILQPLVENCIYHGIRPKGEEGTIKISARLFGGKLVLSVRDTGVGMTREQIEKILSSEKQSEEEPLSESFGLWGTIERVRYYTGRDDICRIESEIGEYTLIEFIIDQNAASKGVMADGQAVQGNDN